MYDYYHYNKYNAPSLDQAKTKFEIIEFNLNLIIAF